MSVIKIKNFGPIGQNLKSKDGLFTVEFSPVTVFIGHQASGKSTMAKLFSIFTWLEKKLVSGDISMNIEIPSKVFKNLCRMQEINNYFSNNTRIIYIGTSYEFEYNKEQFTVTQDLEIKGYILPKIQYISAARNLLTILYNIPNKLLQGQKGNFIEMLDNIPYMVRDLNDGYRKGLSQLTDKGFDLPVKETKVFYKDHTTFIKTKDKILLMSEASSGIQSITPLLIVSNFLAKEVQKSLFEKLQPISLILKKRIENKIKETKNDKLLEIFNIYQMGAEESVNADSLTDKDLIQQLSSILKQFLPSCFINIVEEPEQNLFPQTQATVLYELLKYKNENENNELIISTHSPYILTALNNAIFAKDVFDKQHKEIKELPENKRISFEKVSAYKLENGNIFSIKDDEIRLIDANQIDNCSTQISESFDRLMELNNEQ